MNTYQGGTCRAVLVLATGLAGVSLAVLYIPPAVSARLWQEITLSLLSLSLSLYYGL